MLRRLLMVQVIFLTSFLLLTGCESASLSGFDSGSWKSDKNGCNGDRLKIYKSIIVNQEKLLGLDNRQIIRLLGRPERNELLRRNQKFFIYNISPGSGCATAQDSGKLYLFVRFNAVGLSQEIFIQDKPSFQL